jgi:hypothetical protein
MRLLNTASLEVELFMTSIPRYAILSHRWGDDEVTFDHIRTGANVVSMKGYLKIENSARLAKKKGFDYIWIDTCCIDKSSSAELTEAINSMFHWYRNSATCIAFLSDLDGSDSIVESAWLSRGWTLQELIAPPEVQFYDRFWEPRGTREDWKDAISERTNIPVEVLLGGDLSAVPICCKMSWASSRSTTRPEDIAYCLLGIFDVNLPLLYGEGGSKAFNRLQEAILRQSDDESIFAWTSDEKEAVEKSYWGLLASSPAYFQRSSLYTLPTFKTWRSQGSAEITNRGLRLSLTLVPLINDASATQYLAVLNCSRQKDNPDAVVNAFTLTLQRLSKFEDQYARVRPDKVIPVGDAYDESESSISIKQIFVRPAPRPSDPVVGFCMDQSHKVKFEFPTNSMHGMVIMEGFAEVDVIASEPWQGRQITSSRKIFSIETAKVSQGKHTPGTIDANVKLSCGVFLKQQDPKHMSRYTQFSRRQTYQEPFLLLGFKPLAENGLRTPHAFVKPWYSFSNTLDEEIIEGLVRDPSSRELVHEAPGSCRFKVDFKAITLNFRTFYQVSLVYVPNT